MSKFLDDVAAVEDKVRSYAASGRLASLVACVKVHLPEVVVFGVLCALVGHVL